MLYSSATADTIAKAVIEANLRGADLREANLRGADLRGADLHEANLRGANLHGANLHGANLDEANLHGANLDEANLREADLSGANLRGANLSEANLREADLRGANLRGANLSEGATIIIGSRHVVTVYPDRVSIGCHTRTLAKWLDSYERIGAEEGYTTEQIAEYGEILNRVAKLYEVMG